MHKLERVDHHQKPFEQKTPLIGESSERNAWKLEYLAETCNFNKTQNLKVISLVELPQLATGVSLPFTIFMLRVFNHF